MQLNGIVKGNELAKDTELHSIYSICVLNTSKDVFKQRVGTCPTVNNIWSFPFLGKIPY